MGTLCKRLQLRAIIKWSGHYWLVVQIEKPMVEYIGTPFRQHHRIDTKRYSGLYSLLIQHSRGPKIAFQMLGYQQGAHR